MDSNASDYLLSHSNFHSLYYQAKEGDGLIALGLSLGTRQPEAYNPSGQDDYCDLIDWHQLNPQPKRSNRAYQKNITEDCECETEGVQSKERWAYVKVNMDGLVIGRKICILDHTGYPSLALKLEDMFGRQSTSGLRLLQAGSEFALLYKDRDENWRTVGDVPWKEFQDCVKRLRIVRKDGAFVSSSSAFA